MTSTDTTALELTQDQLRLVKNALESFISDFGHDESDILEHTRAVLAKVAVLVDPSVSGTTAGQLS